MTAPMVRTHSLTEVQQRVGTRLECRGCGGRWNPAIDRKWLERQPCGTRSDP